MEGNSKPLGTVLAGGAATRLGGSKAIVELAGRPLISYPLAAFAAAGIEAVVVAKPGTELPPMDAEVVLEPPEPTHPLLGLITALVYGGRPIVACPCDTPFVTAALLGTIAESLTTAAVHDGRRLHPLLARYQPTDLPALRDALAADRSATGTLEALAPVLIQGDTHTTFNVNTPDDLAAAAAILSSGSGSAG